MNSEVVVGTQTVQEVPNDTEAETAARPALPPELE
jgi:hypothetical protein